MKQPSRFRRSTHPWIEASLFSSVPQAVTLMQVIENKGKILRQGSRPPAIVFDLDSTIFEVRHRTVAILRELARTAVSDPFDDQRLRTWASSVQAEDLLYGLEGSLSVAGIDFRGRKERSVAVSFLRDFWFPRFFANAYLLHDRPAEGAVAYIRLVRESGINIIYLTGRDLPGMRLGTEVSLRHAGFPLGGAERLVMKPKFADDDAEFKRTALIELSRDYTILGIFDNEPKNFIAFSAVVPDAELIFCHTLCSTAEAAPVHGVRKIFDFCL